MRRNKLEMYIDILKVLAHADRPMKLTHIMYKANVNCSVLRQYLDYIIEKGLVEEKRSSKNRVLYAITPKGITTLKYFRELTKVLPIVEEARVKLPADLY